MPKKSDSKRSRPQNHGPRQDDNTETKDCSNMRTKQKDPTRNNQPPPKPTFRLNLTTLTHHITTADQLKELIDPKANYQVIPGVPQNICWDLNKLIDAAIECSRGKLLEVALPFRHWKKGEFGCYYFGRYIFLDRKLIAVRLASSSKQAASYPYCAVLKWMRTKVEQVQIWKALKQTYVRCEVPFSKQDVIPIGDFILELKNVKLGLLFQSELDQTPGLMNDTKENGAVIISILDDTESYRVTSKPLPDNMPIKDPNTKCIINTHWLNAQNIAPHKLNNSSNPDKLLACTGVRMSGLEFTYLTLPTINYGSQKFRGSTSIWYNSWLAANCQLPDPYNPPVSVMMSDLQIPILTSLAELPMCMLQASQNAEVITLKEAPKMKEISMKEEMLPLVRLIYVYRHVNKGQKFTLPTTMSQIFLEELDRMIKYLGIPQADLVNFYQPITRNKEIYKRFKNVTVFQSLQELIKQTPDNFIYVYESGEDELSHLQKLADKYPKLIICSQFIRRILNSQSQYRPHSLFLQATQRFLNKAYSLDIHDMQELLKYARSSQFNLGQQRTVDTISLKLKEMFRRCYMPTPLAQHFLFATQNQIMSEFIEAEGSMGANGQGVFQHQNPAHLVNARNQMQLQMQQKRKAADEKKRASQLSMEKRFLDAKRQQQEQKAKKYCDMCHACQFRFSQYNLYNCAKCHKLTCYVCIKESYRQDSKNTEIQRCLICEQRCSCRNCNKKKEQKTKVWPDWMKACTICLEPKKEEEQGEGEGRCYIKIHCMKCSNSSCYNCAKGDKQYINQQEYICERCTISEEFSILPSTNTPEELKQAQQQKQTQPMVPEHQERDNKDESEKKEKLDMEDIQEKEQSRVKKEKKQKREWEQKKQRRGREEKRERKEQRSTQKKSRRKKESSSSSSSHSSSSSNAKNKSSRSRQFSSSSSSSRRRSRSQDHGRRKRRHESSSSSRSKDRKRRRSSRERQNDSPRNNNRRQQNRLDFQFISQREAEEREDQRTNRTQSAHSTHNNYVCHAISRRVGRVPPPPPPTQLRNNQQDTQRRENWNQRRNSRSFQEGRPNTTREQQRPVASQSLWSNQPSRRQNSSRRERNNDSGFQLNELRMVEQIPNDQDHQNSGQIIPIIRSQNYQEKFDY